MKRSTLKLISAENLWHERIDELTLKNLNKWKTNEVLEVRITKRHFSVEFGHKGLKVWVCMKYKILSWLLQGHNDPCNERVQISHDLISLFWLDRMIANLRGGSPLCVYLGKKKKNKFKQCTCNDLKKKKYCTFNQKLKVLCICTYFFNSLSYA